MSAAASDVPTGRSIAASRPYLLLLVLSLGALGLVNSGLHALDSQPISLLLWALYGSTWILLLLCCLAALTHHQRTLWREQSLLSALLAVSLAIDLVDVNVRLVQSRVAGQMLLLQGALLFVALLALFTWLYWRLDAPSGRGGGRCFWWIPPTSLATLEEQQRWQPGFLEYLYLSCTVSFSFFPCVDPIRPIARLIVMLQLAVVFDVDLILLARAVSLIPN